MQNHLPRATSRLSLVGVGAVLNAGVGPRFRELQRVAAEEGTKSWIVRHGVCGYFGVPCSLGMIFLGGVLGPVFGIVTTAKAIPSKPRD